MVGEVQSAWIAAGASVAVSVVSLGASVWTALRGERAARRQDVTDRDLERLKSRLGEEVDAAKAKRDYEYKARKRLYTELYPLTFQLRGAAATAADRIRNLALASRKGKLGPGPDNWMTGGDPYYFTSVVHDLIAPLAIFELITGKLTSLDLTLDQDLRLQNFIAHKAYEAMRSDFDFIDPRYPPLKLGPDGQIYLPPEARPTALPPEAEQRWTWRQGLYSGQISQAVDALLTTEGTTSRARTYAEFARALGDVDLRAEGEAPGDAGDMKRALRPLSDLLRDFHPARRPITWRILMAQAACYRAIAAAQDCPDPVADALRVAQHPDPADRATFDWIGDGALSIPPSLAGLVDFAAEHRAALATADLFVVNALQKFAGNPSQPEA